MFNRSDLNSIKVERDREVSRETNNDVKEEMNVDEMSKYATEFMKGIVKEEG